jgi:hypothetical protein
MTASRSARRIAAWGAAGLLLAGCGGYVPGTVSYRAAQVSTAWRLPPYADQVKVFGLLMPSTGPAEVLFAPAIRTQPAGPETVEPTSIRPYEALQLSPGAEIRVTAPIDNEPLTDYLAGARVTAAQFAAMYQVSSRRYGPLLDRGHMFELTFNSQGRITLAHQIFSP